MFCLELFKIASKSIPLRRSSRATRPLSRAGIACALALAVDRLALNLRDITNERGSTLPIENIRQV